MKQILQSLKNGETELVEVPPPRMGDGNLLIRTNCTLISSGTERMLIEFGKANLIDKARQQPDKVQMVVNKIKTDGLLPTLDAVRNKLEQPIPLGYCNVGILLDSGESVSGFASGDRIASNGYHAEIVSVPLNLCARIPDSVSNEEAAFTVVGSIALQGIRLVQPTLGESVVVLGLGLIGQIAVQLLRANGCRVMGVDYDKDRLELAKSFGAEVVDLGAGEDPLLMAERFSRGRGVDAVLVTASTQSSDPIHQAAVMSRKRGRIVLVGVTGLNLAREDFFKKELTFQVSASYGPGRYDPAYEECGHDYPIGFVRWTEQRNFEAVLDMMADRRLDVKPLISHRFSLDEFQSAYEIISGAESSMGVLLDFASEDERSNSSLRDSNVTLDLINKEFSFKSIPNDTPHFGFIGAGSYATSSLIPAFKKAGAKLISVASFSGITGVNAAKKFGFNKTTTDGEGLLLDSAVDAIVISTRHNSHAKFVLGAINAGKSVFIEKPLCLTLDELGAIEYSINSYALSKTPLLMVGFNRRFSPHVQKIKDLLRTANGPKAFVMTVNAGSIPSDHWVQDLVIGGGRIVGEVCHFIDLLRFLAGHKIVVHSRSTMKGGDGDTTTLHLEFEDGSIGTIHYFANGSKSFPKERLEIYSAGRILQLDNFRKLYGFGWPGFTKMNLWKQDKGQNACAAAFLNAIKLDSVSPIPLNEILEVSRISILLAKSQ